MLAFIRFNFLLRRNLIELIHADLIAIRAAWRSWNTLVCASSIASTWAFRDEPLSKIRTMADEWKHHFRKRTPSVL